MKHAASPEIAEALRGILDGFPGWSNVLLEEDSNADFRVQMHLHGRMHQFLLNARPGIPSSETMNRMCSKSEDLPFPIVFGTAWIPARRARSLREQGVNYLDTAGNAFLDLPGLQIFRETGSSPSVDPTSKRSTNRDFNASSVKIGLQLLLNPELIGTNLRHLASLAGVSAPSAKFAIDAFKEGGFVIDAGKKGRRWIQREEFFRKWVESYNQRFRPKSGLGRYASAQSQLFLESFNACWGGETAADRLIHKLKPDQQILYTYGRNVGPLVAKNRLRSDSRGDVRLFEACWEKHQEEAEGIAPAFVIFADLVDTRDPRCLEVSEQLFETIIRPKLRADGG